MGLEALVLLLIKNYTQNAYFLQKVDFYIFELENH